MQRADHSVVRRWLPTPQASRARAEQLHGWCAGKQEGEQARQVARSKPPTSSCRLLKHRGHSRLRCAHCMMHCKQRGGRAPNAQRR